MWDYIGYGLGGLFLILAIVLYIVDGWAKTPVAIKSKHILISGGSEGIGKSRSSKPSFSCYIYIYIYISIDLYISPWLRLNCS